MKLFVISLKDSQERRNSVVEQFKDSGIKFEFFDAIDGNNISVMEHFNKFYSKSLANFKMGRELSKGELGLFASNYILWQKCIEINEPIIILEDDIVILSTFVNSLSMISELAKNYECFRLFHGHKKPPKYILINKYLRLFLGSIESTCGYVITPSACKKLISHSKNWSLPIDHYLDSYWLHGVLLYALENPIITINHIFGSEIDSRGQRFKKKPFWGKISRELFRFYNQCYKWIYNFYIFFSISKIMPPKDNKI